MAQGNHTWLRGDITGDIYFDFLNQRGRDPIPYLRMYLMIDGGPEARPVKGLRVLVYGSLAELVYGHVQKGSRVGVEGHIQLRQRPNIVTPVFEVVAERVEFIRNIDYERGRRVVEELKSRSSRGNGGSVGGEAVQRLLESAEFAFEEEPGDEA